MRRRLAAFLEFGSNLATARGVKEAALLLRQGNASCENAVLVLTMRRSPSEYSVLAARKPSRFANYLSLPLVVAIVLLLVAKLAALQRADLIAELADRVAHRDTADAAAAVRQLALMPRPPVTILVSAVASADRELAEEAKLAIGRVLRRAQRQIEAQQGVSRVAAQLSELAESLAAHQPQIAPADYPWLSRTTRKVLRLANRIPGKDTPLVAMHCDTILGAIAPKDAPAGQIVDRLPPRVESESREAAVVNHLRNTGQASSTPQPSAITTPPSATTVATGSPRSGNHVTGAASPAVPAEDELLKSPWRPAWSHPVFRMVPAMPIQAVPVENDPALPTPPPAVDIQRIEPEPGKRPLAGADSRELLRRWMEAEGREVLPLEQELTRRGFSRLSERLVQQLFSQEADGRLRLMDDVLTEPGIDARPWLVLLADDADADVRLLAVTIMATSNDAVLIDKAWQVSLHDRDPRVSGLAARLRERRDSTLRR